MKYLKLFESTTNRQKKLSDDIKELKENREDIANVLIYYYDNFFDNITNEIAEFVYNWGRGEDVADSFVNTDILTKEEIYDVIDNLISKRDIDKFLTVYYDCCYLYDTKDDKIQDYIKEVFLEYSDMGDITYSRLGNQDEDTYKVEINAKNIITEFIFSEVFGRLGDAGFGNFKINAQKDNKSESLTITFSRPFEKE